MAVFMIVGFDEGVVNLNPYGYLFGLGGTWTGLPWPSPPSSVVIPIGGGFPTPFELILQGVGFKAAGIGNVSNPEFVLIE